MKNKNYKDVIIKRSIDMVNEIMAHLQEQYLKEELEANVAAADMLARAAEELTGTAQRVDRAAKTVPNEHLALALQIVTQDILEQADNVTEALRIVNKSLGSKPM